MSGDLKETNEGMHCSHVAIQFWPGVATIPGEYSGCQVIEWGQNSKPNKPLGLQTKPPKNRWTKI